MLMLISMLFMFICTFINSNYWLTCAMHWKVLYKDDKTNRTTITLLEVSCLIISYQNHYPIQLDTNTVRDDKIWLCFVEI